MVKTNQHPADSFEASQSDYRLRRSENLRGKHKPVLLREVLRMLDPQKGESYLDLTAGYGGHAKEVLARTLNQSHAVLVDRDLAAINHLQEAFAGQAVTLVHDDFFAASQKLSKDGEKFDLIFADLGVSSIHLDNAQRGFSLRTSGPLDMRMDQTQELTAAHIVNNYDERELTRILRDYGEEPKAARIAGVIIAARPLKTTDELAAIAAKAWPGQSRMHPATRTFQAVRIAVNSELEQLEKALPLWIDMLSPGGRIAVISFHSLEDRIVKRALAEASGKRFDSELKLLSKGPVLPDNNEIVSNPRARSAKLRAAVKIKNKERRD